MKEYYGKGSGLHKHHIVPKHSGGSDHEDNLTYLTVREHIVAHYLLWKVNRDPNDLRSMHMLGANLSTHHRRIVGEWCRDNKIGFHGADPIDCNEWRSKGWKAQEGVKGTYAWWASDEGRKVRASMGGRSGYNKGTSSWYYWSKGEGVKIKASLGGLSHKGKKAMYRPGDTTFIRVHPSMFEEKLGQGYVFGSPLSPRKGIRTGTPSPRRRAVTDGKMFFSSLSEAANYHGVTPAAIIGRCKSTKNGWKYIS